MRSPVLTRSGKSPARAAAAPLRNRAAPSAAKTAASAAKTAASAAIFSDDEDEDAGFQEDFEETPIMVGVVTMIG